MNELVGTVSGWWSEEQYTLLFNFGRLIRKDNPIRIDVFCLLDRVDEI